MGRHWSIAITFDESASEDEQVQQIIESAERCLINIDRVTAEKFRQQIDYHYSKDPEW